MGFNAPEVADLLGLKRVRWGVSLTTVAGELEEPEAAALRPESRPGCGLLVGRLLLKLERFPVGGSCTLFTLLQLSFW